MYSIISKLCGVTTTGGIYWLTEPPNSRREPVICDLCDDELVGRERQKRCEAIAGGILRAIGSLFSGVTMNELVFELLSGAEHTLGPVPPILGAAVSVLGAYMAKDYYERQYVEYAEVEV